MMRFRSFLYTTNMRLSQKYDSLFFFAKKVVFLQKYLYFCG